MQNYINAFLDVFAPPCCSICHKRIKQAPVCYRCAPLAHDKALKNICISCSSAISDCNIQGCMACQLFPLPFNQVRFLWSYNDPKVASLISIMKYRPAKELCKWAGRKLAASLEYLYPIFDWDIIVPIPSSKSSLHERMFNQCHVISQSLIKTISLTGKLSPLALRHYGKTPQQASLSHSQRLKNVSNCFKADSKYVSQKSILLIDDVITTGATSVAACLELLNKGARKVDLLALARADSWLEHRQSVDKYFSSMKAKKDRL